MQKFTSGDVTVSIEIERFMPNVGEMGGYRCDFVWWLEVDGVEYVSGESTHTEVWWTSNASGEDGWNAEVVSGRIDNDDLPIDHDIDMAVEQVTDWFGALREYVVGAWFAQSRDIAERANEDGLLREQLHVAFLGQEAWALVNNNGDVLTDVFYSTREEAETAAATVASMQDV